MDPALAITGQVSDIVIHDRSVSPHKIYLLELTCPWDSPASFLKAHDRKTDRYNRLTLDLEEAGLKDFNLEIYKPSKNVGLS